MLVRRWRRARAWLTVTAALHLLIPALTFVLLQRGPVGQMIGHLLHLMALGVVPVLVGLWMERRRPSIRKPDQWPLRSFMVAFPQAIALGFAMNGVLDKDTLPGTLVVLIIFAVALLPAVTAFLAYWFLLRPLIPELGAGDFEVLVEFRTPRRPWYYNDILALTDRELQVIVNSGSGRSTWGTKVKSIALTDITAVGVRPALPQDSPWITLTDGRGLSAPPGDVVVVTHHAGAPQVLPVVDAAVVAEMVRTRVAKVRGITVGTPPLPELPVETAAMTAGHVPEVLPAPEPFGPVARPISGPATPPQAGPGMTVRRTLGYPLALLGIVGVPIGVLIFGGLLPADPGLERYRLANCLLWTGLSTGIWLCSWRQPRYWPIWAITSVLHAAFIVAALGRESVLLAPIAAVLLTWAGRRVLLRPIALDLAGSGLEIPVRHGNGTLLVQQDRLVLKLGDVAGGVVPQALPLAELTLAQPGRFVGNTVGWWPLPGGLVTRLGSRPVLRLVAGRQQWLIPVDAARELAAIIRARAAAARPLTVIPLTVTQWYQLQFWAARKLTKAGRTPERRTVGFRLAVAFPLAWFGLFSLIEAIGLESSLDSNFYLAAAVTLPMATGFVVAWTRVRRRLRIAQDNPLPPGSPNWGDIRPDRVPLAGWQPWWDPSGLDQLPRSASGVVGSR